MSDNTDGFTGGCLCGANRYRVEGAPLWVAHCHCDSCRRNCGAAVATFVGVSRDSVTFEAGEPRGYHSSPGVTRSFCSTCGTPLSYESDRCQGEIHLLIGTLDAPERFEPECHVFVAEQLPWLHLADELPRYAATGRDADPLPRNDESITSEPSR